MHKISDNSRSHHSRPEGFPSQLSDYEGAINTQRASEFNGSRPSGVWARWSVHPQGLPIAMPTTGSNDPCIKANSDSGNRRVSATDGDGAVEDKSGNPKSKGSDGTLPAKKERFEASEVSSSFNVNRAGGDRLNLPDRPLAVDSCLQPTTRNAPDTVPSSHWCQIIDGQPGKGVLWKCTDTELITTANAAAAKYASELQLKVEETSEFSNHTFLADGTSSEEPEGISLLPSTEPRAPLTCSGVSGQMELTRSNSLTDLNWLSADLNWLSADLSGLARAFHPDVDVP